ncbi:putative bifunctional diguanylate cyclase/phosphodiesterase [Caballeronia sp. S22]|uniref:putative bifunctional diguanylate cyclase/phosphodiesterase n=1 Tax=Caballeronia sp. S22 TaxID=3137182 RepID=UPI0035310D25
MNLLRIPLLRRLLSLSGDSNPSDELSRCQFEAFARQLPLLHVILIINTVAVAITHIGTAPAWLARDVPISLCAACLMRLATWLRRQKRRHTLTDAQIAARMRTTLVLIGVLGVLFTTWGLALYPYGDAYARVHVAFYMSITVIGCVFCLMHTRAAALLLTAIVVVPFSLFFALTHNVVLMAIAANMLLVAVAMVLILLSYYRDFARLVESRRSLRARQAELLRLSEENSSLANLDSLTGLPNRRRFFGELNALVPRDNPGSLRYAVGVIDLDGFKQINDLYGHAAGDRVLEEAGCRLLALSRPHITLARLGGDEFGLLIRDLTDVQELVLLGTAICEALRRPYVWLGATLSLSGSIGLAIFPEGGETPDQLFEHADYALYFAKTHRRGGITIFSHEHESQIRKFGEIEQALRHADLEREMSLHFQPIVDVTTARIISFEALARWQSPILGAVPPSLFIKVAERSHLIHTLTEVLLGKALRIMKAGAVEARVSFNLSALDLASPDALERLISMIRKSGVAPDRLTFEVTETAVINDFEQAQQALKALKTLGAHISLDDFGTGFSSLNCIHRLPLDKIKVDRSFIADIETNVGARDIVRSIVDLCRSLSLACVIEGVETPAQVEVLRQLGCEVMQGFHFGRPSAADGKDGLDPLTRFDISAYCGVGSTEKNS